MESAHRIKSHYDKKIEFHTTDDSFLYRQSNINCLGYELQPFSYLKLHYEIDINSIGLRDEEVKENSYKILVLGDSVTFGFGLERNNTYPEILEELLRTQDQEIQVINAGIPGYNVEQELCHYERRLERLNSEIVIWALAVNDLDQSYLIHTLEQKNNVGLVTYRQRTKYPIMIKLPTNLNLFLMNKIHTYRAINNLLFQLRKPNNIQYYQEPYPSISDSLEIFKHLATKNKFQPIIVIFPNYDDTHYKEYEKLKQIIIDSKLPFVDVLKAYQNISINLSQFRYPNDPIHPNAYGNIVAAEAILEEINS